jgi:WD40 repeat protein
MRHESLLLRSTIVLLFLWGSPLGLSTPSAYPAPQKNSQCGAPLSLPASSRPNIFGPEQEIALGDAIAESEDSTLSTLEDDALTAHIRAIGERLLAQLPASGLRFRFYLSESPQANAFSIGGGRVYVTRKMVSFLKSDDELAAVVGHELGHIVTHQMAIDFTGLLRQLNITQVGDASDVFDKVNLVFESRSKLKRNPESREQEQLPADRVGLEAVARAGYDPQAFFTFFDRLAETKGKTGTWFSELLKSTPPNSKRLREIAKEIETLSAGCSQTRPSDDSQSFLAWRTLVLRSAGAVRRPAIHNVVWKKFLDPPLAEDFRTLRFSPDGKFILAQDSASIYVLSREPLAFNFRIDAPSAWPAQFTPDSQAIVFYSPQLRVERWDIASRERADVSEIVVRKGCFQTRLSPDGQTLACLRGDFTLLLIDVASGNHIFEKQNFYGAQTNLELGSSSIRFSFELHYINLEFSPDARYFLASAKNANTIAFDLSSQQLIPIRGAIKEATVISFAFVGSDEIAGTAGERGTKSLLVRFPSGDIIRHLDFGSSRPTRVAHGDYILLRPIKDFAVGVLDPATNEFVRGNKETAFDVYDKTYLSLLKGGEIGLFQESATPIAALKIPLGPLGTLKTADVSPDLNSVAVSFRDRGAVWDLKAGQMIYNLRGFWAGWFGDDGALYAEFPKQDKTDRSIAQISISPRGISQVQKLDDPDTQEHGRYLATLRPPGKPVTRSKSDDSNNHESLGGEGMGLRIFDLLPNTRHNEVLDVRDVKTGSALWSIPFPKEVPRIFWSAPSNRAVFVWRSNEAAVKAEQQRFPDASHSASSNKETNYQLEIVDLTAGKPIGWIELDTHDGAFGISFVRAAADYIVVTDTLGRLLMYSVSSGKMLGKFFGRVSEISSGPNPILCIERSKGRLELYQPGNRIPSTKLQFSWPTSLVRFTPDGKQLFVLTSDQAAYLIDIPEMTRENTNLRAQ